MAAYIFCFLAVICSLLHQGLSITCYQCNSFNDPRCLAAELLDSLRVPCGPTANLCRKITQDIENQMQGMPPDVKRVIRECGHDNSKFLDHCYRPSGYGSRQEVCSCIEDDCNIASTSIACSGLLLLTFALITL